MKPVYLWAIVVWFLFAVIAVINGAIRNSTYQKWVGDLYAHQISTIIFILLVLAVMYLFFNFSGFPYTNKDLWVIGFSWLIATIIFEFVFGHYVFGNSWEKLLTDYNLLKGRIWSLVLLFTLIGPWLVGRK
jgi:NADH:ubiquinone oxidoreductase subunit 6 (subunit J)